MSEGLFNIGDVVEANKDIDYGYTKFAKKGERFVVIDYVLDSWYINFPKPYKWEGNKYALIYENKSSSKFTWIHEDDLTLVKKFDWSIVQNSRNNAL